MIKKIIFLIIIGLVLLGVGFGVGVFYQSQKYIAQSEKFQMLTNALKPLSSKTIPVMHAVGIVEKISGRKITISYVGESVELLVPESAEIISFTSQNAGESQDSPIFTKKDSVFGDIKLGDRLNVSLKISPEGQIEVTAITIVPVSQKSVGGVF